MEELDWLFLCGGEADGRRFHADKSGIFEFSLSSSSKLSSLYETDFLDLNMNTNAEVNGWLHQTKMHITSFIQKIFKIYLLTI